MQKKNDKKQREMGKSVTSDVRLTTQSLSRAASRFRTTLSQIMSTVTDETSATSDQLDQIDDIFPFTSGKVNLFIFLQGYIFSAFYLEKYPNRKKRERRLTTLKFSLLSQGELNMGNNLARGIRETDNWAKSK